VKQVNVAVGVIIRDARVLLAKRALSQHQGGKWEFSGGKIEAGETLMGALAREIKEELDIDVSRCREWMDIEHNYPDKAVCLKVCLVEGFSGEPKGVEGQPLRWVAVEDLGRYEFPEANREIVQRLMAMEFSTD
jgi:8-oxo-dGTP diphosphatase